MLWPVIVLLVQMQEWMVYHDPTFHNGFHTVKNAILNKGDLIDNAQRAQNSEYI